MGFTSRRLITQQKFVEIARCQDCGTQSYSRRPEKDECAWQVEATSREFLQMAVYPAWFLGPDGGDFKHSDDPLYHRILFRDALNREDFRKDCLFDCYTKASDCPQVHVMVLHCTKCDHMVVIDGHHRLTTLAILEQASRAAAKIAITGLSGSVWASDTPDINKVCQCLAP